MLIHVGYAIVFFVMGLPNMGYLNVASTAFYMVLLFLCRVAHTKTMIFAYLEIVLYASLATIILGMETGFFLYIIGMMVLALGFFECEIPVFGTLQGISAVILIALSPITNAMEDRFTTYRTTVAPYNNIIHSVNMLITVVCIMFLSSAYLRRIGITKDKLIFSSEHDELTSLYNRTYINRFLNGEKDNEDLDMAVLMLDIDHFKHINDVHGHNTGDVALKYVADRMEANIRKQDFIIRWGGEEFLIFLNQCPLEKAGQIAESIRYDVSANPYKPGSKHYLTVTLGVTHTSKEESLEQTINRADKLLYEGKNAGRDRVVIG